MTAHDTIPPQLERGALLASFQTRPEHTRALGRLRLTIAALSSVACAALWLGELPLPVALVASLATALSLAWWRIGRNDLQRSAQPPDGLWLHANGLLIRQAGSPRWLAWPLVSRVSIDEDLLRVRVHCPNSNDVCLSDHYPGHAIEEVALALARAAGVPGPYARDGEGSHSPRDDLQ